MENILIINTAFTILFGAIFLSGCSSNPYKSGEEIKSVTKKLISENDLQMELVSGGRYRAIKIVPEEIITNSLEVFYHGQSFDHDDILKIAVVERYGKSNNIAKGLVHGMGIAKGAIAPITP